jgi:hypothetical protein
LRKLLTSYFDIFSRLEVTIPVTLGVTLSFLSFHATEILLLRVIACLELAFWLHIYIQYRENRARFVVQGHGPVPKGCWISPPASVLVAGDLILTSGRVATNLRESVGHAEMVIVMPDGKKKALSSYMVNGLVLNPLEEVASKTLEQGHYIVLRLRKSLTRQQSLEAANIALEMMEANERWKNKRNEQRHKMIFSLPLSQGLKIKLYHMVKATGYDWLGLLLGRLAKDHWTCIAACLEVYRRLGIKTNSYGTGLFGFGSSIFDPIMPVRFLSDPAFRLLQEYDKDTYANNNP